MIAALGAHGTPVDDACCGDCPCDVWAMSQFGGSLRCTRGCGHVEDADLWRIA